VNPNLNNVLGLDEELFKHVWLQKQYMQGSTITLGVEPYDRDLTKKDANEIDKLIKKYKPRLLKMFNVSDIDIDWYI